MSAFPGNRLEIVSDGTTRGTKVYLIQGDQKIDISDCVTGLTYSMKADGSLCHADLRVCKIEARLSGTWKILEGCLEEEN